MTITASWTDYTKSGSFGQQLANGLTHYGPISYDTTLTIYSSSDGDVYLPVSLPFGNYIWSVSTYQSGSTNKNLNLWGWGIVNCVSGGCNMQKTNWEGVGCDGNSTSGTSKITYSKPSGSNVYIVYITLSLLAPLSL